MYSIRRTCSLPYTGDRFVPDRRVTDMDLARMIVASGQWRAGPNVPSRDDMPTPNSKRSLARYSCAIASELLGITVPSESVGSDALGALKNFLPVPRENRPKTQGLRRLTDMFAPAANTSIVRKAARKPVARNPIRILDAPGMQESFHSNLLDWGSNSVLSVALSDTAFLWNPDSGTTSAFYSTPTGENITSLSWLKNTNYIALGTQHSTVQVWDAESLTCVREMRSHAGRIGSLAWNGPLLSSGSRDGQIHHHDVRLRHHHIATMAGHSGEICGLKWNSAGTQLASGGNDNLVNVWDNRHRSSSPVPVLRLTHHKAAVKALAWAPWSNNLLATGGGTGDGRIMFWNTNTGNCVRSRHTGSAVCSILWSPEDKELVTGQGLDKNIINLWKYPTMTRIAELTGHTSRVMHMALSPDGQTVASAASDETVRLWKIFEQKDSSGCGQSSGQVEMDRLPANAMDLRRDVSIR